MPSPLNLLAIILGVPLVGMLVLALIGRRANRTAGVVATACWAISLLASIVLFVVWGDAIAAGQGWQWETSWISIPNGITLPMGLALRGADDLLMTVVTLCGTLVSLVSTSYMGHDPHRARYFALLLGFGVAMLALIVAPNALQLFVCYELVGLASYLLIGFWHTKREASRASLQAFLVNRVGDVLLLAGIICCQLALGTTDWARIATMPTSVPAGQQAQLLYWAGWLIPLGAIAKSAQLPYSGWLPDAMAGPTPVSALLHAATMVAAGVVVLVKAFPLLHADVRLALAWIGALTALYGAWSCLIRFDLKRLLAYSTISQLGYMVLAIGVAAPDLALFHLTTHAFFKCALFLAATAVLHHLHHTAPDIDVQDMRLLGGLRKQMPIIFGLTLLNTAALIGLPLTSGFASKDAILGAVAVADFTPQGTGGWLLALGLVTVMLTAGYMTRWLILIFWGVPRNIPDAKAHLPWVFPVAVGILTALSVSFWYQANWFSGAVGGHPVTIPSWLPWAVLGLVASGIGLTVWLWKSFRYITMTIPMTRWRRLSYHGLYLTEGYQALARFGQRLAGLLRVLEGILIEGVILLLSKTLVTSRSNVSLTALTAWLDRHLVDGLVRGTGSGMEAGGEGLRRIQTGRLQQYLLLSLLTVATMALLGLWLLQA